MQVTCNNCGKTVEVEGYKTFIVCSACNTKIEIKNEKTEDLNLENKNKYLKAKENLIEAYESRQITYIVEESNKVLKYAPDDFLARFLLAYCSYIRGKETPLVVFFEKDLYLSASKKDIEIVLQELAKIESLSTPKAEFICKLEDNGIDCSTYENCTNVQKKQQKEKHKNEQQEIQGRIGLTSAVLSFLILFCCMILTQSSFMLTVFCISSVYVIINYFIVRSKGYGKTVFIISLILSAAVYPLVRLIVVAISLKANNLNLKDNLEKVYYFEGC